MKKIDSYTSLFLSQSYIDAQDDFNRALMRSSFPCWDYIVLTASNEHQAEGFRLQIAERQKSNLLPKRTKFVVIPDPNGKRVGSGGATLGVLRYIAEETGSSDFAGLKILVIHSGGDSKRVPQYSALGKLFSPVPHELAHGRSSTLFDEFMIAMATLPGRIREGMLLVSGDVLLLFNPLLVDYSGHGAAAISFKEDVETGKNHGVFLRGEDGNVQKCLQKQTVETLRAQGAVNEQNCVDIDTGAVIFSKEMLQNLYQMMSENGVVTDTSFEKYVNEKVRLSLYADFLYPLGTDATLEAFYQEKPEGEFCPELMDARKAVWEAMRPFRMKLLRLAPAKFIHFGTSREILHLMSEGVQEYRGLGWNQHINSSFKNHVAGYNSVLSSNVVCGQNCYLENSYVHQGSCIGDRVILSYVDIHSKKIPSDVVLHGLKQMDGRFVARIYGINDNPKGSAKDVFLGSSLEQFMEKYGLDEDDLWGVPDVKLSEGSDGTGKISAVNDSSVKSVDRFDGTGKISVVNDSSVKSADRFDGNGKLSDGNEKLFIWDAKLYACGDNIDEAVDHALNLYALLHGEGDLDKWKNADRKSLHSGFDEADTQAIIDWDVRMNDVVRMDRIMKLIDQKEPAEKGIAILNSDHLTKIQKQWFQHQIEQADYKEKTRLYYYVGTAIGGAAGEELVAKSFAVIREGILKASLEHIQKHENCRIVKDECEVNLPLRVNWGGGWSDTPPYCNEMGGNVLNAAIKLNGEYPVHVRLERTNEKKIVFVSRDMDVYAEFTDIKELKKTGDPYDPCALQKAALLSCGIISDGTDDFEELLQTIGGGFVMHSEVTGVPKGSGLGTSSILAAACVKGLFEFFGIDYTESDLYSTVLCMEQIMSTGGGWQDQVGGMTEGIKWISSAPGLWQELQVRHMKLSDDTWQELQERFGLIYTGQRRLARNLLRDVVGRYIGSSKATVDALNEIQKVAVLMHFELNRGNVDEFADLMNTHWELSKQIDEGSTNTLIDQIFESIEDLLAGKMICGAGGGGFLQVVLKKGVSKEAVHERLKEVFMDSEIEIWDCELV